MSVLVQTSFGDITIDLWTDKCPKACLNFIKLCKIKHYNNALFMEVQKNYITRVQTQRPTTIWKQVGKTQNNPFFNDELDMQLRFNELGYIATANKGPHKNNSEFFITLTKADLSSLNGKHTVFGKVVEGFDVLRKINDSYVDANHRPQMNVRIMHTFILDDPFQDLQNMKIPESPKLQMDSMRLEAIEHIQMSQKYQKQEDIEDAMKKQKAKKQAVTLEMLGDLPDANIKPPQNILFVCKLNPITQERDLQIIFSRFGPIKSVEVVRDWKTGQSLQYAFIQFQNQTACEEAYLKMNNVLIDDRRIHVDFSQSVSKLMPKGNKKFVQPKKFNPVQTKQQKQIVKVGRKIESDIQRYGLITSKPDYLKHAQQKLNQRKEIDKNVKKDLQQNQAKKQKIRIRIRSISQQSNKQRKQKNKKNYERRQSQQNRQRKRKYRRSRSYSGSRSSSYQSERRRYKDRSESIKKKHKKQKKTKQKKKYY